MHSWIAGCMAGVISCAVLPRTNSCIPYLKQVGSTLRHSCRLHGISNLVLCGKHQRERPHTRKWMNATWSESQPASDVSCFCHLSHDTAMLMKYVEIKCVVVFFTWVKGISLAFIHSFIYSYVQLLFTITCGCFVLNPFYSFTFYTSGGH